MKSQDQTTQQLMFSLIEVWKGTTQSQLQFCKERELNYGRFQYWYRKYRAIHSGQTSDSKFFKQVILDTHLAIGTSAVELLFPDGRKLVFHSPVEASFLRHLLA